MSTIIRMADHRRRSQRLSATDQRPVTGTVDVGVEQLITLAPLLGLYNAAALPDVVLYVRLLIAGNRPPDGGIDLDDVEEEGAA